MSLKRKIKFSNLPPAALDSSSEASTAIADGSPRTGPTEDPFTFPGTSSGSSSLNSDGQKGSKIPRLVLKLGSPKKPVTETEVLASEHAVEPPATTMQREKTPEKEVPLQPIERTERKKRKNGKVDGRTKEGRLMRKKLQQNDVNVNDILSTVEGGKGPGISKLETDSSTAAPVSHVATVVDVPALPADPPLREPLVPSAAPRDPFESLLEYYVGYLERKDNNRFFAFPITDLIAPNYCSFVKHPMDFSTMRKKAARGWYENLQQFKNDFELVCSNAMTYNAPDTIYYRAARKLSRLGRKLMTRERLPYAKRTVQGIDSIPQNVLNFEVEPSTASSRQLPQSLMAAQPLPSTSTGEPEIIVATPLVEEDLPADENNDSSPPLSPSKIRNGSLCGPYESIPEENAEEILAQLRQAGKDVADRLATRRPKLIMPTRQQDGSISLTVLNPDCKSDLTIGALAGPLKVGSDKLPSFDKRPRMDATTVFERYYKDYGSFSSHAPMYDSKGFVFTKDEVDILRSTYGSDRGVAYAESLMRWGQQVRHPVVKRSIEKLINDASGGEHSDVVYLLNERIVARADEERARFLAETATVGQADLLPLEGSQQSTEETFQQLRSLATEGIDVGFLEALPHDLVKPLPAVRSDVEPEALLTMNGELLHQLYLEQTKRMATASTAHLGNVPLPGEMECSLAEEAVKNLSTLLTLTAPKDIVSASEVRKALNIC